MRRRILLLVVGMTTLVVVAFAIPMAVLIRTSVASDAETATTDQARATALALRSNPSVAQLRSFVASIVASTGRPTSVTLVGGRVIGSTPADKFGTGPLSAGGNPDVLPPAPQISLPSGYDGSSGGYRRYQYGGDVGPTVQLQPAPGGQVAVAFAAAAAGTAGTGNAGVVRVYLSDSARYRGENADFALLGGAALLLIVIGIVAGELLTRRIVRPLVDTAATAQRLGSGDTTARAPTTGPAEIADVGLALNRLADRIDQLIAEERETVADLSHRLRTPLTALRLDAEALRDDGEAERVGGHVSALERTLTAVIHAARRPQREGRLPSCDASAVVADRVAFWSALAEDQGRAHTLELPAAPLVVRAGTEDLAAAVDALLENVVAHTPEGTPFAVRLADDPAGARLTVSDDGPGLPPDASVRGRSDRGSSGLGLDIARRCAESSGGAMTLGASPSGGALITLLFSTP